MSHSIVDKIRKLLNLSRSSNVNEAANAAARAQELMLAHKIEVADLEVGTGSRAPVEAVNDEILEQGSKRAQRWRLMLASKLATAFGCRMYYSSGGLINVVGTVSAIQTVKYMQGYLALEITRLCDESCGKSLGYAMSPITWRNSFKDGAVHAIGERLQAQRKEQERSFSARPRVHWCSCGVTTSSRRSRWTSE